MDCEGYKAALSHNVKKMVRRQGRGIGPPGPVAAPADAIAGSTGQAMDDMMPHFAGPCPASTRFAESCCLTEECYRKLSTLDRPPPAPFPAFPLVRAA